MSNRNITEFNEASRPTNWPAVPENETHHVVEQLYACCIGCDNHNGACQPQVATAKCLAVDGHEVLPSVTLTVVNRSEQSGIVPSDCDIKKLSIKLP